MKIQDINFERLTRNFMDAIIKNSLAKAINYYAYSKLVRHLAENGGTTGVNSASNSHYTKLNDRRMKRWDKTLKIPLDIKNGIHQFSKKITWLILTESWCGDAAHVIPVLNKITELNENIEMKLVLRDENPELMDAYLTRGNRAIPKIIMIDDESGEVLDVYGPRPSVAANYVKRYKALYGKLTPEFKTDLQHWYNNDKGLTTLIDISQKLCRIEPTSVCQ